ncbi:Nudix family hydrolase [Thiomicrorhabdus sp. Kp2]|uniref:Nudix family hydrolase n=1 Tax=Thiomicrorhabdus sp. Kp2 TaxID=1123518 RepID=UPI00041B217B|nr:Nudix family hydrolase [Thiomicrorhabdus sp. Kp2]
MLETKNKINSYIDIAVGVLKQDDKVCLSLRQKHQSHANHWEFPGGKVEEGESIIEALQREFFEELAIQTKGWQKLIEIPWHYEKVSVRLHVYQTEQFRGKPTGNEGQRVEWFAVNELSNLEFPKANKGIVTALQLSDSYMITGQFVNAQEALQKLTNALDSGVRFCQLRAKGLSEEAFLEIAKPAIKQCQHYGAKILLNGKVTLLETFPDADGIQLASNEIDAFNERPIAKDKILGVSTHTDNDISQALKLDADFILLSPVKETTSHPEVPGIGWSNFADKVKDIPIPVFALGGMKPEDIDVAKQNGGQGIAAISGFWPS